MYIRILFLLLALTSVTMADDNKYALIPVPNQIKTGTGVFKLDSATTLFVPPSMLPEAGLFRSYLQQIYNYNLPLVEAKAGSNQISVRQSKMPGTDAYVLQIESGQISINVTSPAALLYAFETLKQLLPPARNYRSLSVPCMTINDSPRFAYRGMHLDVVRHFFTVDQVKRYIDRMVMYKFNTLHWHLTDDQGWRIEIKKYPLLTKVGAYRNGTLIGHYNDIPQQFDTIRYGGFYTQDQIRDVIKYAAERHINIVPEIEMPGHAQAALAAYPEYGCVQKNLEVGKTWGVYKDIFCPTEETFTFLENILTEVCALFPGPYIHIGGDEVPKDRWKESPFCQKLIKEKGLRDEEELQRYFTNRILSFLRTRNKIGIGWDEILNEGLDSTGVVMSWRGHKGGFDAAKKGHDVIMAPYSHVYFDYYQTRSIKDELAIGGYLPLSKVYSFDPVPEGLTEEERKHILGAQACVWTEYIADENRLQEMTIPRMAALSEVLWSDPSNRDFDSFGSRMIMHLKYLRMQQIRFSNSIFEVGARLTADEPSGVSIELVSNGKGEIRYTLDGTSPTINSPIYKEKIKADQSVVLTAAMMFGAIKVSDDMSVVFKLNHATGRQVTLNSSPYPDYSIAGIFSLVDGRKGRIPWLGDEWLGFFNTPFDAVIDLGSEKMFSNVSVDMLKDSLSNIHLPKSISVSTSNDNISWTSVKTIAASEIDQAGRNIRVRFPYVKARFVKIVAENKGGFLFVDEISID